jgi:hypothetical protein
MPEARQEVATVYRPCTTSADRRVRRSLDLLSWELPSCGGVEPAARSRSGENAMSDRLAGTVMAGTADGPTLPQRLVAEVISWCERAAAGGCGAQSCSRFFAPPSRSASSSSALRTATAPVRPAQRRRQPRGRLPPSTRRRGRVGRSRCRSRPTAWRWSEPTCWWPAARPASSAPSTWVHAAGSAQLWCCPARPR